MKGFREVGWVAAVAGTALGCYMVSLKVASERASLETVEDRIVLAQRDIRVLQTEIGTRGRLEQLEAWNAKVLALSAPQAHQFMEGGFQLATLSAPKREIDPAAPVVLASAPRPEAKPALEEPEEKAGPAPRDLMQVASYKRPEPEQKAVDKPKPAASATVKPAAKAASAKPKDPPAKPEPKAKAAPVKAAKSEPVATTSKVKPARQ